VAPGRLCRYWRWKSSSQGGRPQIEIELRVLIRQMSTENQLWGAPRIHGELLKLGFSVAQSTVAKYMVKRCGPPSQGWLTFLRNHAPDIADMDLFVVPTIGFRMLYGFVIVRLDRRDIIWINVTTNPTAEWVARQITEAFPWDGAPGYMIRDRDQIYGAAVTRRLRAGHSRPTNCTGLALAECLAERWVRSVKEECLSKIILFGERSLRRAICEYIAHYHAERNHQGKDNVLLFPRNTDIHREGAVQCRERLGGFLRYYHQEAA
jgi:hypothetical protein